MLFITPQDDLTTPFITFFYKWSDE